MSSGIKVKVGEQNGLLEGAYIKKNGLNIPAEYTTFRLSIGSWPDQSISIPKLIKPLYERLFTEPEYYHE